MNHFKKYIALLLVVASLLTLAACGSGNEEIIQDSDGVSTHPTAQAPTEVELGKNVGVVEKEELKKTDMIGEWMLKWELSDLLGSTIRTFLGKDTVLPEMDIHLSLQLQFTPEGAFSLSCAVDEQTVNAYIDALEPRAAEIIRSFLASEAGAMIANSSIEGYYDREDKKIWMALEQSKLAEAENYLILTVENDLMTVTQYGGSEFESIAAIANALKLELPWTLEKVVTE